MNSLYLECHVTIDPIIDEEELLKLKESVIKYGFKIADLIMLKGSPSLKDTFMTSHSLDLPELIDRLESLIIFLNESNIVVRRYKIEDVIIDSRTNDYLNLL
jgi:hypothetical protein